MRFYQNKCSKRRHSSPAFLSQSSTNPVTGELSDNIKDIDDEHIAAQNDEMVSWLSTPPSTGVKYAIAPGQSYKPVLKKRTASGSTKLSEGSLAGISALRTTKSRIDDLVKQHDDHAKHVFKYYTDAYQRRMGKPWSSHSPAVHTVAEPMQDIQSTKPKEPETHSLKRSSTLPTTLEAHPPPISRAATIAIEPSAAGSSRASKPHRPTASNSVVDTPQKRQKTLDVLMELQRRARAEWVLATENDRKKELYENYLQAKDNRKRFKASIGDASMEKEGEETESNTAQESTMSHLQHLYPRPADLPMKPQLQGQSKDWSRHPSSVVPGSASAIFKIPTQDAQRHQITSRRPSVDTTTSDESNTAPSKPTIDPRRRPSVSIGFPMNAGRPKLPKLATNVPPIGPAASASVSATPMSATPTADPRRRPVSANVSAAQTPVSAGGTTVTVAPMVGSSITATSSTEAQQLNPYLDKARDPRRRPQ